MNEIGKQICRLHNMWLKMKQSGYRKGFSLKRTKDEKEHRQAVLSVIDIFDRVKVRGTKEMMMQPLSNPLHDVISLVALIVILVPRQRPCTRRRSTSTC